MRWDAAGQVSELHVADDAASSQAFAVNDDGVAVGRYWDETYHNHAVRWASDGTAAELTPLPGAAAAQAWAIADDGTVVGDSGSDEVRGVPVRWAPDGTVTALALPKGADRGSAKQITDDGWIAGYVWVGSAQHVVRWAPDGTVTDLGAPATWDNQSNAIADDGTVAGTSSEYYGDTSTTVESWGQTWDPAGKRTQLARPAGLQYGKVADVNNSHVSVGSITSSTDGGPARWNADGSVTMLGRSTEVLFEAVGINDTGVIAGTRDFKVVRWSAAGVLTELGVPQGSAGAMAVAVNEGGSVLGSGTEY